MLRDVGPSGVSAVELWYTQDGHHWQKAERLLAPTPPFVFEVKEDGRYGITLVPRSGVGISRQPPMLGEAPQVWVEVDTTRPMVRIKQVKFEVIEQAREVSITWGVQDRNLPARPIRLLYADRAQGPWRIIAETENTGGYRWHLPAQMPREFFVRLDAIDSAGNVGSACTNAPVVLDLAQPAIEIVSVEPNRTR
jgi:hypothetical protein